ncbi:MFS transporter [Desulforamulus aeronauticus]|uniref:MFS transporter, ACDE family, multidrug resistance protein n=1 Tax=Desulforamulus aeronauticus DSM 10349 TaxID=1121421 RepID=A0A1M6NM50_9FIRM|nr:MFS transporter [Desulforamulus aeronauticus]SHJ96622.1 MFS transporter, ACDE family, multidrug resistance protein [Desulforamulus aeronauticus DSM 10349]
MSQAAAAGNKNNVNKFSLTALAGVPLIMVLGNSMLIPVLPEMAKALKVSQMQISLIITLFSVPAGLVIPFAGFLSDRFGRKKIIIPGLILYALGGLLAGAAALFFKENAFPWILGGRVIQGIGAAGTAPIAMAFCGDLWKGKERAKSLGIIEASNGMGKVTSPILGALVGLIAWWAIFFFFPIVITIVILGVWFLTKEPDAKKEPKQVGEYVGSIKKIFKNKSPLLLSSFFAGSAALLILFGVLFYLSDFLEKKYGLDGVIKGAALAIPVLFMSTTSYITGAIIKKMVGLMKWLVVIGHGIIAVSLVTLPLFNNVYAFFAGISLAGIGTGLVLPCLNTLITSSTDKDERGLVTSLYGSVRFLGVAAGPPLFGWLVGISPSVMFWASAGLAGVAAGLAFIFIKVKAIQASQNKEDKEKQKPKQRIVKPVAQPAFIYHSLAWWPKLPPLVRKPLPGQDRLIEDGKVNNGDRQNQ